MVPCETIRPRLEPHVLHALLQHVLLVMGGIEEDKSLVITRVS